MKTKTKSTQKQQDAKIVGAALAEVLPQSDKWWFQRPHLLQLNLTLIIPLMSSSVSGYDGSLMNGLQTLPQWNKDFNDPSASMLGLVNGIMPIAMFLALPFLPWVTDRFGRRVPIMLGCAGTIVATLIQIFAVNFGMFCFARSVLGFSAPFMIQPAAMLLLSLLIPHTERNIPQHTLQSTISARSLPLGPHLSPRWLVAQDRVQEASDILSKFHDPTPASELVAREMSEIVESIHMEREANTTTWASLFATPGNRKRVLVACSVGIFAQWNGVTVVSYYLTKVLNSVGITDTFDQTLINGMLQIFNFGAALTGAFLVDRLGRRTLFLWSTIGMLITYVVWTACSAVNEQYGNSKAGIVVVVCLFFYYFHYDIAWTPLLFAYPTEIFPYSLRAKGLALEFYFNSAGLIIGQFVNPIALENIGWRYYIVFSCLLVLILGVVYFLFPETKGYSLEEIAVNFDGPMAETSLAMDKRVEVETAEHKETVV